MPGRVWPGTLESGGTQEAWAWAQRASVTAWLNNTQKASLTNTGLDQYFLASTAEIFGARDIWSKNKGKTDFFR